MIPRTAIGAYCGLAVALLTGVVPNRPPARGPQEAPTIVIGGQPTCRSCTLAFTRIAVLDTAVVPTQGKIIYSGALGDDVFVGLGSAGELVAFHASGRVRWRSGRSGDGPGEFRSIDAIWAGPADSIFVFDRTRQRVSVLEPARGRYARSIQFSWPIEKAVGVGSLGAFIAVATVATADAAGFPLHLVSAVGGIQRSFGNKSGEKLPLPKANTYAVRANRGDAVWMATDQRYAIELWSPDGKLLKTIQRKVEWFPDQPSAPRARGSSSPYSRLLGIQEDKEGRLWTISVRVVPHVERTLDLPLSGPGGEAAFLAAYGDQTKYVEVLDPTSGEVVASIVTKSAPVFIGNGLVIHPAADSKGNDVIEVRRMSIQPEPGGS